MLLPHTVPFKKNIKRSDILSNIKYRGLTQNLISKARLPIIKLTGNKSGD